MRKIVYCSTLLYVPTHVRIYVYVRTKILKSNLITFQHSKCHTHTYMYVCTCRFIQCNGGKNIKFCGVDTVCVVRYNTLKFLLYISSYIHLLVFFFLLYFFLIINISSTVCFIHVCYSTLIRICTSGCTYIHTHIHIVGWITLGWLKLYKINMNFGWMNIFITV